MRQLSRSYCTMMGSNGWEVDYTVWLEGVRRLSVTLQSAASHLEQLEVEIKAKTVTEATLLLLEHDAREFGFDPLPEVRAEVGVITELLGRWLPALRALRGVSPQFFRKAWGREEKRGLRRAESLVQKLMAFPLQCEAAKPLDVSVSTFYFETDISRLISALNSNATVNNNVFLFELLSNSSNALDERCLSNMLKGDAQTELFIKIFVDKAWKTLTIKDSGIGMTMSDLVGCLGRNARSGTNEFINTLTADADVSMIGNFGLGFYSAFLVSKQVTVCSNQKDGLQHNWESQSSESFTVSAEPIGWLDNGGTHITLYLKDDQLGFLEEDHLKNLVIQYARVIGYPIELYITERTEKEIDYHMKCMMKVSDDSIPKDDWKSFFPIKPYAETTKGKKMQVSKDRLSLSLKPDPIWLRNPEGITREEYAAFYKSLTKDREEHLAVKHFSVDGQVKFSCILFVPKSASFNHFGGRNKLDYVRLYVQNGFAMNNNRELIPERLSFVKGIVDTEDFPPLNTPTQTLHQDKTFNFIRHNLLNKCIELFSEIAENQDDYKLFYEAFSENIKLFFHEVCSSKKIAELLRYHSTETGDELTSLKDYVTRMKEGQTDIYYIAGESKKDMETSPSLDPLKTMGYEVLFMVDKIDELIVEQLNEFEGKNFQSAIQESVKKRRLE